MAGKSNKNVSHSKERRLEPKCPISVFAPMVITFYIIYFINFAQTFTDFSYELFSYGEANNLPGFYCSLRCCIIGLNTSAPFRGTSAIFRQEGCYSSKGSNQFHGKFARIKYAHFLTYN